MLEKFTENDRVQLTSRFNR